MGWGGRLWTCAQVRIHWRKRFLFFFSFPKQFGEWISLDSVVYCHNETLEEWVTLSNFGRKDGCPLFHDDSHGRKWIFPFQVLRAKNVHTFVLEKKWIILSLFNIYTCHKERKNNLTYLDTAWQLHLEVLWSIRLGVKDVLLPNISQLLNNLFSWIIK